MLALPQFRIKFSERFVQAVVVSPEIVESPLTFFVDESVLRSESPEVSFSNLSDFFIFLDNDGLPLDLDLSRFILYSTSSDDLALIDKPIDPPLDIVSQGETHAPLFNTSFDVSDEVDHDDLPLWAIIVIVISVVVIVVVCFLIYYFRVRKSEKLGSDSEGAEP